MSKHVRLPEDFVEMLDRTYEGDNYKEKLENWKSDNPKQKIVELIEKIEQLDVNSSSTTSDWSRSEISDIAEEVVYSLMRED